MYPTTAPPGPPKEGEDMWKCLCDFVNAAQAFDMHPPPVETPVPPHLHVLLLVRLVETLSPALLTLCRDCFVSATPSPLVVSCVRFLSKTRLATLRPATGHQVEACYFLYQLLNISYRQWDLPVLLHLLGNPGAQAVERGSEEHLAAVCAADRQFENITGTGTGTGTDGSALTEYFWIAGVEEHALQRNAPNLMPYYNRHYRPLYGDGTVNAAGEDPVSATSFAASQCPTKKSNCNATDTSDDSRAFDVYCNDMLAHLLEGGQERELAASAESAVQWVKKHIRRSGDNFLVDSKLLTGVEALRLRTRLMQLHNITNRSLWHLFQPQVRLRQQKRRSLRNFLGGRSTRLSESEFKEMEDFVAVTRAWESESDGT